MAYGLSTYQVKEIIQRELDKNPDLKYYINNPYFDEFISLLIDGISMAIVKNSQEFFDDIKREKKLRY